MLCSSIVIGLATLVLIGWQYRIYLLKTIPGQVTVVAPNTAACFIVCGISILLLFNNSTGKRAIAGRLLGAAVFLFAGLTLSEYIFNINLGIDGWFFHHRLSDWPVPTPRGRFAVQTAFGLTFLGAALMLLDRHIRSWHVSEILTGIAGLAPLVGMLGYIYRANPMHGVMAGATVILFAILWTGAAFVRPDHGAISLLLSETSGGIAARRLITSTTILLVVSGWVRIRLQYLGYTDLELGTALFVTWALITVILLIFSTAQRLDRLDHERAAATSALAQSLLQKEASEDRLNEGLETANAAIWDMNFLTGEFYWSKGHYTLLGYADGEVKPSLEAWKKRVHPEDAIAVEQQWKDSIRNHTPFACQYRVIWPDGSFHWMETHGKVEYAENGEPIRSIGGFVDVTERVRSQQALMEAEKIAVTGRMAATLAHEINNPLAAVTNLIYLLRSNTDSSQAQEEFLKVADDEIRRVAQLVQKTLSFYRADVHPGRVHVAGLMDDIIWLYKNRIRELAVKVEKEFDFDGEITCNAGEIRQVLTNVFVNAIEAVRHEGRIVVRIAQRTNGSTRQGVYVWIHDDGPGIPATFRSQLFTPFSSMKGDKGTGLGLWISKGIMEKNGGAIRFRSRTGERHGTCFSVFIPDKEENTQVAAIGVPAATGT